MNTPIKDLFALAEEAISPVIWTEKKALQKFKEAATPEQLREVAEAFRALEQRAEAAEHERDCHMDIAEHFKARCKELEQQKPYGYVHNLVDPPGGGVAASIFKEESRHYGRPLFTRPALTAQPVKFPDNVPCKGAPQFVWLQVSCDTGNPSEWPEHPEAGVTWHTEQIHSDDVLYIRANNDEVQE